jgi:pantoate--beta-alanine ligase
MSVAKPRIWSVLNQWSQERRKIGAASLGFVPTMGALHEGHLSLIKKSQSENSQTLVSLFVNPTQFNDPKDLANYPRPFEYDLNLLTEAGVDHLLMPNAEAMYPDHYRFQITEKDFSQHLCGQHRPGHFSGMLTVVLKLINLAQATKAYFGEKDYQQYLLIRDMVQALFLPTEIVACPTIRAGDGLALSSRNQLLTAEQRQRAPLLAKLLRECADPREAIHRLQESGFEVDYVEDWQGRRFGAAHLGKVRLIDNIEI